MVYGSGHQTAPGINQNELALFENQVEPLAQFKHLNQVKNTDDTQVLHLLITL